MTDEHKTPGGADISPSASKAQLEAFNYARWFVCPNAEPSTAWEMQSIKGIAMHFHAGYMAALASNAKLSGGPTPKDTGEKP